LRARCWGRADRQASPHLHACQPLPLPAMTQPPVGIPLRARRRRGGDQAPARLHYSVRRAHNLRKYFPFSAF